MADLTERLAAKLEGWTLAMMYGNRDRDVLWLHNVTEWLPLLLSEPELVASLPDAVRVQALESLLNSAPVMESAFVDAAEVLALAPEELRLSVLTPRERAVMLVGECAIALDQPNFDTVGEAGMRYNGAMAKYHALSPSPAPLEGTNDE